MSPQASDILYDWIESVTAHYDVIASWEQLTELYNQMTFTDVLDDDERIKEYKWMIKTLNSFQTRLRKSLLSCKNVEAVRTVLKENYKPKGKIELSTRKSVAYQKLRQQYIERCLMELQVVIQQIEELQQDQEDEDAWTEYE